MIAEAVSNFLSPTVLAGYVLEWRPGDYCYYRVEDFQRETQAPSARIWPLFTRPMPGCPDVPAAYKGRFWHSPKHYAYNYSHDPDAVPLYPGPMVQEPQQ